MKNKAAVALGRRDGKAKNAKLTKEQRNEMMAAVRASRWPQKINTLKVPARFLDARLQTVTSTLTNETLQQVQKRKKHLASLHFQRMRKT
jgi:hypothetical protein